MDTSARENINRQQLLGWMTAVRKTAILRAAVELDVFAALATGTHDSASVAVRIGADPRGTRILLDALAAIGLVERTAERYHLTAPAADLLVPGRPGYFGDAVHLASSTPEWAALQRLAQAVRKGGTVLDENAETPDFPYWQSFANAGTRNTQPVADLVADHIAAELGDRDLRVLDTACGHGLYGLTLAARLPRAQVTLLDWPSVLTITERNAAARGLTGRTRLLPGDMFTTELDGPYDVALITNVLHHFSPGTAQDLLRRLRDTVRPGGLVVVVAVATDDRPPAEDPIPHLFSVLMLGWTRQGEVHTAAAYRDLFTGLGLKEPRVMELPHNPLRVIAARRA
ncbi:methyltransferase [Micromonospora sp. PTRAS2]